MGLIAAIVRHRQRKRLHVQTVRTREAKRQAEIAVDIATHLVGIDDGDYVEDAVNEIPPEPLNH